MRESWLRRAALIVLGSVFTSSAVRAQADASLESVLIPGSTVWITDSTGREERTRILGVSGDVVSAAVGDEVRRLRAMEVVRVRARRADSVLDGALIGAGLAVGAGLFLCTRTEPWENCRDDVGPMLRIGALGAGAGIGIDALIRGRRTIYEAPERSARLHLSPIAGGRARGLQLSVTF
jgi:hypothetical protein